MSPLILRALAWCRLKVAEPILDAFTSHGRMYWLYLASALVVALIAGVERSRAKDEPGGARRALERVFDPAVWWHASARLDYAYFAVDAVVFAILVVPWLATGIAGREVGHDLAALVVTPRLGPGTWAHALGLTVAFVLASD